MVADTRLADAVLSRAIVLPEADYNYINAIHESRHDVTDVDGLVSHLKAADPKLAPGLLEYLLQIASAGGITVSTATADPAADAARPPKRRMAATPEDKPMARPPSANPTTPANPAAPATSTTPTVATATATEVPVGVATPIPETTNLPRAAATPAADYHSWQQQDTRHPARFGHDSARFDDGNATAHLDAARMHRLSKLASSALATAIERDRRTVEPESEISANASAHLVYVSFPSGSAADAKVRLEDDGRQLVVDGVKVFSASSAARNEIVKEVMKRGLLTDRETLESLTVDDLVPVVQELLRERGLGNVEYEPLALDLPNRGVVLNKITTEQLDSHTIRITIPKRQRHAHRTAPAGYGAGYGYSYAPPSAYQERARGHDRGNFRNARAAQYGYGSPHFGGGGFGRMARSGMAPAWAGPAVGYGGSW